jgi:ribosomal protein S18 acetylase RimI-like enzyme
MKFVENPLELDLSKSPYLEATTVPQMILGGWQSTTEQAVLVDRPSGLVLYFQSGCGPAFYARVFMEAAAKFGQINSVNVESSLLSHIQLKDPTTWLWMTRFEPIAHPVPANVEFVEDGRHNNAIQSFIARSGFSAHMQPGHPDVEFWAIMWSDLQVLPVAVAAGSRRISGERVINTVVVDPTHRSKGLGAAITSAATAEIFRRGSTRAHLGVRIDNAPAIRVYEKLGFELVESISSSELK